MPNTEKPGTPGTEAAPEAGGCSAKEKGMMENGVCNGMRVYRGMGAHLHRLEQFPKAIEAYDEAYKYSPDDIRLLIGRAASCVEDFQQTKAHEDAKAALQIDPNNLNAIQILANTKYAKLELEQSVLLNSRGLQKRREPKHFFYCMNSGLQSIKDNIGEPAGQVLHNYLPFIDKEQLSIDKHQVKKVGHISRIPHEIPKVKISHLEAHKHALLSRLLTCEYLGPMSCDKLFLQNLTNDPRIDSANVKGSQQIKKIVNEAVDLLNERQNLLRGQRPYHTIQHAKKSVSHHVRMFKKNVIQNERKENKHHAEHLMLEVTKLLKADRINELIKQAERMQLFLDIHTEYTFPEKGTYSDLLYRAVGEGYLSLHRLSYSISERSNRRRIAFLMGLNVGRPSSYDSVLANYPHKFVSLEEALSKALVALEDCDYPIKKCWLNYEISRLLCKQKNYMQAKIHARCCQREAQENDSPAWWLNGCFALIATDMQQANIHDVRLMTEEAYKWANETRTPERVLSFLKKCNSMAATMVARRHATEDVEHREKQILNTLEGSLKEDAKVLFRKMKTIPVGRRFSVLPRGEPCNKRTTVRCKRKQRNLTIVPGHEPKLLRLSYTPTPGFQVGI